MSDNLAFVLNRALDVAALGNYVIKTITIYVVIVHTPKKMRHFANLILNGLLWNFTGNALYSFAHMIPMMPAECFQMDGLLSAYFGDEFAGQLFFTLVMLTVLNACIASFLSFQFRYMDAVHSVRISKFHPAWGYFYSFIVHAFLCVIYVVVLDKWRVPVADYPEPNQISSRERLFCYKPHGADKNLTIFLFFGVIFVISFGIAYFSARSFQYLNQKHPGMHEKTILLQKRLLRNLLYLTAIPIVMGGVPLLLAIVVIYFNELSAARTIASICIVILLNHGTIYGITILVVFKNYRTATCRIRQMVTTTEPRVKFTRNEVAAHNCSTDLWIIYRYKVYNMTPYYRSHPGGDAMLRCAGQDATFALRSVSAHAISWSFLERKLAECCIGELKE